MEYLPFLPGCKQRLRPLLVLSILTVWAWCPWLLLLSFEMLMILVESLTMSSWITTRPLYFRCFASNSAFFNDKCPLVRQNELWRPTSWLHQSSFLLPFVKFHAEILSNFSHSLSTTAFAAGNKFVYKNYDVVVNCFLFLQRGPHCNSVEILQYAVVWIHWLPRQTQILTWNHQSCYGSPNSCSSCMSCEAYRELLVFPISIEHLMVSLNSLSSRSMK